MGTFCVLHLMVTQQIHPQLLTHSHTNINNPNTTTYRTMCSMSDCSTPAHRRGLCSKHGGSQFQPVCSVLDCTTNASGRGLCVKHGAKGMCQHPVCTTAAIREGLCTKHGANGVCSVQGCITNARNGVSKLCGTVRVLHVTVHLCGGEYHGVTSSVRWQSSWVSFYMLPFTEM
jgi:hypothetical protein